MRVWITFWATLALAGAASGATVTVVVNQPNPDPCCGDIVTITTTLTTDGTEEPAQLAILQLLWSDSQVQGVPGPVQYDGGLTSGSGLFSWQAGAGNCLSASCLILGLLSPIIPAGSVPDPGTVTTTLVLTWDSPGLLNLSFGTTSVFGATPQFIFVPQPSTGALLGLGLGVLASARRRR